MPGAIPGEGYLNTNWQLFGKEQAPSPIVPAVNQGFVTNFATTLQWESQKPGTVMAGTVPGQIMGTIVYPAKCPADPFYRIATGYAVCDHWYGSAPTETAPNRAFMATATSQGSVTDASPSVYTAPSIFTLLGKNGKTWAIYGYNAPPLTRGSIADITSAPPGNFGEFANFKTAVQNGTLANYVFLEPSWGQTGNNQHPNSDATSPW